MSIKDLYQKAKSAAIGSTCKCPSCGVEFVKASYQQAFCKTKNGTVCKDKYWNTVTPEKRNNTTRISPANASWSAIQAFQKGPRERVTSEGYAVRNGVAYDEFGNPVYNIDPHEDAHDHGQWND